MDVLRYVLPHLLAGCLAGLAAAGGIVATDLGSLRELMAQSDHGWLAGVLLAFGFVVTFGSAAVGRAIIELGDQD
jgi:ABC-type uncharacterized transport system permease subunit